MAELIRASGANPVRVRSPRAADLVPMLRAAGGSVDRLHDGALAVYGLDTDRVAELAAAARTAGLAGLRRRGAVHDPDRPGRLGAAGRAEHHDQRGAAPSP